MAPAPGAVLAVVGVAARLGHQLLAQADNPCLLAQDTDQAANLAKWRLAAAHLVGAEVGQRVEAVQQESTAQLRVAFEGGVHGSPRQLGVLDEPAHIAEMLEGSPNFGAHFCIIRELWVIDYELFNSHKVAALTIFVDCGTQFNKRAVFSHGHYPSRVASSIATLVAGRGKVAIPPSASGGAFAPLTTPDHRKRALGWASARGAHYPDGIASPARLSPNAVGMIVQSAAVKRVPVWRPARSFLTRRADNSSGLNAAYKAAFYSVSSDLFASLNPADKLAVKCQRAIAAAAQQTRCAIALSAPRPAAGDKPGSIAAPGARAAASVHLTPARWQAINWWCQSWQPSGSGEAVPAGTALEPLKNHQHIDIAAHSLRFQRFHLGASHNARDQAARVIPRLMRGVIAGTLEPLIFISIYQVVSGSRAVLERFSLEPLGCQCRESGAIARFPIKLGIGYWLTSTGPDRVEGSSTVNGSRAGRSFGDFSPARLELGWSARRGQNGGFLRLDLGGSGLVGRPMLDGSPLEPGNASFSGEPPLPVRLGRGLVRAARGGIDWTWHPPLPPFAPLLLPSTLRRQTGRILISHRADTNLGDEWSGAGPRQSWNGTIGSGLGEVSRHRAKHGRGRGRAVISLGSGSRLRRSGQASAGCGHVN